VPKPLDEIDAVLLDMDGTLVDSMQPWNVHGFAGPRVRGGDGRVDHAPEAPR
jgi:hypothetical protein